MVYQWTRFVLGLTVSLVLGFKAQAYYGRNSTEANLSFTGRIELSLPGVSHINA